MCANVFTNNLVGEGTPLRWSLMSLLAVGSRFAAEPRELGS